MNYIQIVGLTISVLTITAVAYHHGENAGTEESRKKEPAPVAHDDMILVHGGAFDMGDIFGDDNEGDEKPVHRVTVGDVYIAKTELTVREWRVYIKSIDKAMPDAPSWGWHDDHPMVNVSWLDAIDYCNWRSRKDGYMPVYTNSGENAIAEWNANGYRLPTEAEWEYAARSSGKKHRFGNGSDIADPARINFDARANYARPYSTPGQYRKSTAPVGSFRANAIGLFDMSGNAWEWVWDRAAGYGSAPQTNPRGSNSGEFRIVRGGSWDFGPWYARTTSRSFKGPDNRNDVIGFRLARSARNVR